MKEVKNKEYVGERSLFHSKNLKVEACYFHDGESPLKESRNIDVNDTTFSYKYPLWYGKNINVSNSTFLKMARSGIWYTKDLEMSNCYVKAPKQFRRSQNISIYNSIFDDASETLWNCKKVKIFDSIFKGDYLLMNSKNIKIRNLTLDGNYFLDGASNIYIENSKLSSKDAFWNCKNVYIKDSYISGEYFGWNSKNVTLENCIIESHQGFCYMKNLKLINCKINHSDLCFEYSEVEANIDSTIDSIKNPLKGYIRCHKIGNLIIDENKKGLGKTKIIETGEK